MPPALNRHQPPLLARWLMALFSLSQDGFAVLGDMAEEYGLYAREQGTANARRWYWRQVAASAEELLLKRLIWSLVMLNNDWKSTLRNLGRQKLFTAINLVGLSVGLAAFILITLFVLFESGFDTTHPQLDRLYRLSMNGNFNGSWVHMAMSPPAYGPLVAENTSMVDLAARVMPWGSHSMRKGDEVHAESVNFADAELFDLLDLKLIHGQREGLFEANYTVALSRSTAQKYFGNVNPVGQSLIMDNRDEAVVQAVFEDVPRQNHFRPAFLVSLNTMFRGFPDHESSYYSSNFYTYLRLAEGADTKAVESWIQDVIHERAGEFSERLEPILEPVRDLYLHSEAIYGPGATGDMKTVQVFTAIALFILLMACVNFVNLTTARSTRRAKEVAVRKVMGSQRAGLVRQFLGESVLLTLISLGAALIWVQLLMPAFNSRMGLNLSLGSAVGWTLVLILGTVTLITGLLAGSYPAWVISAVNPVSVLRGRGAGSHKQRRIRQWLVVLQFGISVSLIFISLTVARQTGFMKNRDPGFERENVVHVRLSSPAIREKVDVFKDQLLALPQVVAASTCSREMGSVYGGWSLIDPQGAKHSITALFADADYCQVLGIEMAQGRMMDSQREADRDAYLLNQTLADLINDRDLVGKTVHIPDVEPGQVVGIMKDFNYRSMHKKPEPLVIRRSPNDHQLRFMAIRLAGGDPAEALDAVKTVWRNIDPDQPMDVRFLDDHLDSLYWKEERLYTIVMDFTVLAVVIGALGLLGLAAYSAERRRKEVAIRKVMGASIAQVVTVLGREYVSLVALSALWAWPAAWLLTRQWLQQFPYRAPVAWWILPLSGVLALVSALLVVGMQGWLAALASPVHSLKDE